MTTYIENGHARFSTNYSDRMITDPSGIIADFRAATKGVKYDTIVGRGSSGMLIVPVVARALKKNWLVIRKDEEVQSSHSDQYWLGKLGRRWVFLDDFCSSGATFRKTRDGVREAVRTAQRYNYEFDSELVGYFEYEKAERGFTRWDVEARPGYSDYYFDDIPGWEQVQAEKAKERREYQAKQDAYTKRLMEEEQRRRDTQRELSQQLATYSYGESVPDPALPNCGTPGCIVCGNVAPPAGSLVGRYAAGVTINDPNDLRVKVTGL